MNKLYDRIDFENNNTPALNETNLNLMSKAIDDIDNRVIDIAGDVLVVVPEILDKYADIEALATNPPYVGQNGHWWTWDTDTNQYVDSGIDAGVSVTVGTTTTLPAGSDATVTNSGTDTDPILNFGIPQGAAGQNGQDGQDGTDGVSPEVTIGTITGGHSVTITDADHPAGQTFNVMDGADGVGVPSGGTTGQVLKKVSGTDYDTEWANESGGGSGGHTIINSAGTSMTQRTGLQFSGLNVTDDSTNDKTVVTLPTPDYVDEQFNPSTTYSKGMTCIEGNVRYRYKNSTATSGHRPPNTTYWEVLSVAGELASLQNSITLLESMIYLPLFISGEGVKNLGSFTIKQSYSGGSITITTDYIEELRTGSDAGDVKPKGVFTNAIDVTNYKRLVVRAEPISGQNWNYYSVGGTLSDSNTDTSWSDSICYCNTLIDSATGLREGYKDLSNITGSKYLWLGAVGQRSCRIRQIYLSLI